MFRGSKFNPFIMAAAFFLLLIGTTSNARRIEARKCCIGDEEGVNGYTKDCGEVINGGPSSTLTVGDEVVSVEWAPERGFPNCSGAEFPSLRVQLNKHSLVELRNGTFGLFDAFGGIRTEFCLDVGLDERGRRLEAPDAGAAHAAHAAVVGFCEASQKETCHERPCFSLCCPEGYFRHHEGQTCRRSATRLPGPPIRDKATGQISLIVDDIKYYDDETVAKCGRRVTSFAADDPNVTVWEDGSLQIDGGLYDYHEFCVDYRGRGQIYFKICASQLTSTSSSTSTSTMDYGEFERRVITYASLVSCGFYVAAFGVVWTRRRGHLFGVMLLFLIGCLGVVSLAYSVIQFTDPEYLMRHPLYCQFLAFLLYFFYISSSCWLACMGVNIYTNFRQIRNPRPSRRGGVNHPHFKRYLAVALVIPSAMCAATLIMHLLPEDVTEGLVVPGIGRSRCFIEKAPLPLLLYFHFINVPCNIIALLCYLCTSYNLCCGVWRNTPPQRRKGSVGGGDPNAADRRAVTLIKLFFVLGISWGLEELSLVLRAYGHNSPVLFFCDLCNASQGVVLCLVVLLDRAFFARLRQIRDNILYGQQQQQQQQQQRRPSSTRPHHNNKRQQQSEVEDNDICVLKIRMRDENSCSDMRIGINIELREDHDNFLGQMRRKVFFWKKSEYPLAVSV